ncbi:hypothetical protein ABE82_26170 (plasmid) [Paenibacillus peoriae]|uniref:hypothetical protein n=1 Tax=Paenibacillus peoriae TaxID=59893 RepID=UPI000722A2C6|nr:hypothetical protein [Paenibacillus peoriae]ALS09908.1 hypothetical protein ABE82_26170 [Paenibacillus peoriae]
MFDDVISFRIQVFLSSMVLLLGGILFVFEGDSTFVQALIDHAMPMIVMIPLFCIISTWIMYVHVQDSLQAEKETKNVFKEAKRRGVVVSMFHYTRMDKKRTVITAPIENVGTLIMNFKRGKIVNSRLDNDSIN